MVGTTGFEPVVFRLSAERINQLCYIPKEKGVRDERTLTSNLQPLLALFPLSYISTILGSFFRKAVAIPTLCRLFFYARFLLVLAG